MNASMEKDTLVIALSGHIDSGNAPAIESEIMQEREKHPHAGLTLDLRDLAYISSAGLRVLLAANKLMVNRGGMSVRNVQDMVMEVLEATGFTDVLTME